MMLIPSLVSLALASLAGMAPPQKETQVLVFGEVSYRQRIALSPDAVVHVYLRRIDAEHRISDLTVTRVPTAGKQVPIPFEVVSEGMKPEEGVRYVLQATIEEAGKVTWRTSGLRGLELDGSDAKQELMVIQTGGRKGYEEKDWVLYELGGKPSVPAGTRIPGITFSAPQKAFSAFAGVNQMGGSYERSGHSLRFGATRSTMMAGPQPQMDQEAAFGRMLGQVDRAKAFGRALVFYSKGKAIAKFRTPA